MLRPFQMSLKVAEMLKHEPLKLRFTQSNGTNGTPKSIIRRQGNLTVAELIQPSYMSTTNNLLYYELLDVSIIELETKKSLKITWVNAYNKEDASTGCPKISLSEADTISYVSRVSTPSSYPRTQLCMKLPRSLSAKM